MNKGFILDGYPRTQRDAKAVFMDMKEAPEEQEPKPSQSDTNPEAIQQIFELSTKIVPQFCIIFDAENDFLKQRVHKLPKEEIEGTHFND